MKITVCELPDRRRDFQGAWAALVGHVVRAQSDLVLLPQTPFCEWFMDFAPNSDVWTAAVQAHDAWEQRLGGLGPALVLGTRPIDFGNERYEEAFAWDAEFGMRSMHANSRPAVGRSDTHWYTDATADFAPFEAHGVRIGFLIGAELWMDDEAPRYAQGEIDVIAMPRSAGRTDFSSWLAACSALAESAQAYVLSSNRSGSFGGRGWAIAPDGRVLGVTSESEPFLSLDLETLSERAEGRVEPHPAPAWVDPLDTGVPPFP